MAAVCGAVAGCGSQPAPPAAPGAGLQEGSLPKRLTGGTPLPKDPWWQQSRLLPHFQEAALRLRDWLPPELAQNFRF